MNRVNLDLKKLLGFKIIASQLNNVKSLTVGAKLGVKVGIKPRPF